MTKIEASPVEATKVSEGSERSAAQKLDDATFEPRAVVERAGDYKQSEAIQQHFTTIMENAAKNPASASASAKTESAAQDRKISAGFLSQTGMENAAKDQAGAGATVTEKTNTRDGQVSPGILSQASKAPSKPKGNLGSGNAMKEEEAGGSSNSGESVKSSVNYYNGPEATSIWAPGVRQASQNRNGTCEEQKNAKTGDLSVVCVYPDGAVTMDFYHNTDGSTSSENQNTDQSNADNSNLVESTTTETYDDDGNPLASTETHYDENGNPLYSIDTEYDEDGNPESGSLNAGDDSLEFGYDKDGNPVDEDGVQVIIPDDFGQPAAGTNNNSSENAPSNSEGSGQGLQVGPNYDEGGNKFRDDVDGNPKEDPLNINGNEWGPGYIGEGSGDDKNAGSNSESGNNYESSSGNSSGNAGSTDTGSGDDKDKPVTVEPEPDGGEDDGEAIDGGGGGDDSGHGHLILKDGGLSVGSDDDSGHMLGVAGGRETGSGTSGGGEGGDDSGHRDVVLKGGGSKVLSDNQPGVIDPINSSGDMKTSNQGNISAEQLRKQTGKG